MAIFIQLDDLAPFATIAPAKAQAMIDDAVAAAIEIAPCITSDDFDKFAAVRQILRAAILRWNEAGSGALSSVQQGAGAFNVTESLDTRLPRRSLFWPQEITQLQKLCKLGSGGSFSLDRAPGNTAGHALICSVMFGATYCSCGADISGGTGPLYEDC